MEKIINGSEISAVIKEEIKQEISNFHKKPCLAVVVLGNNPASFIYIRNKEIACEYVGIKLEKYELFENTSEEELLNLIDKLNKNENINGILVQLPLPKHIDENKVILKINPHKDVDGFHPYNIGMLLIGNPFLSPCTPCGCIEILKRANISLEGKKCVVIGRSNIVGKPLSMLLIKEDATVTIAHSKTTDLTEITKNADIVFLAIGKPKFLKADMIKKDAIIIDIGINRTENGICGDCDFEDCLEKASYITPVPKGIGPMTITMLLKNCVKAFKFQNNID